MLLGTPWYVVNLAETGSLDGGLGDTTGQSADHSVRVIVGTLRALSFDIVDTSGLWRSELYVVVGVGGAMVALGVLLRAGQVARAPSFTRASSSRSSRWCFARSGFQFTGFGHTAGTSSDRRASHSTTATPGT